MPYPDACGARLSLSGGAIARPAPLRPDIPQLGIGRRLLVRRALRCHTLAERLVDIAWLVAGR